MGLLCAWSSAGAEESRTICGQTVTAADYPGTTFPAWFDDTATLVSYAGYNLGTLSTNLTETASVLNEGGTFGSTSSAYSIFNAGGVWGSPSAYANESACNPYAQYPPAIRRNGQFVGYLTENAAAAALQNSPRLVVAALLKRRALAAASTTTTSSTTTSTTSTTATTTTTSTTSTTTSTTLPAATPLSLAAPYAAALGYVVNRGADTISVIDLAARQVVNTISAGSAARGIAASPDGRRLYVPNMKQGTLSVVDTATNNIVAQTASGPWGVNVAVTPDGSRGYVANDAGVGVVDLAALQLLRQIVLPASAGVICGNQNLLIGAALAMAPDGRTVYVGHWDRVYAIDTASNSEVFSVPLAAAHHGLALTPDGKRLYVTNSDCDTRTISVIDIATRTVVASTAQMDSMGNGGPHGMLMHAGKNRVYVVYDNVLVSLDLADTAAQPALTRHRTFDRYVRSLALSPDGKQLYVGSDVLVDNVVYVVDVDSDAILATLPVGKGATPGNGMAIATASSPFQPRTGVEPAVAVESNVVVLTGLAQAVPVSISGAPSAQFQVSQDNGASWSDWAAPPATVANGDRIRLKVTAAAEFEASVTASLALGERAAAFSVTTRPELPPSGQFSGYTVHGSVALGRLHEDQDANAGYNDWLVTGSKPRKVRIRPAPAEGVEPEFMVIRADRSEVPWIGRSDEVAVAAGDKIRLRARSQPMPRTTSVVEMSVGSEMKTFTLTTQAAALKSLDAIAAPPTLTAGQSARLAVTGTWTYTDPGRARMALEADFGSEVSTTFPPASWSISGSGASIDAATGLLTAGPVSADATVTVSASHDGKTVSRAVSILATTTTTAPTTTTTSTTTAPTTTTTTTTTSTTTTTAPTTTTTTSTTSAPTTTTTSTTTTTTTQPPAATLSFVAGWNLAGNGVEASIAVPDAFGDAAKVATVWKWLAGKDAWAFYTPSQADGGAAYAASKGYEHLAAIAGGEGFWVNAKAAFALPLPAGAAVQSASFGAAGTHALQKGWSLIATGDLATPPAFNCALGAAACPAAAPWPTNLTTLWAWDADKTSWYFWAPSLANSNGLAAYLGNKGYLDFASRPASPPGTLAPTTGFWVNLP